jgi:hypothetical protein
MDAGHQAQRVGDRVTPLRCSSSAVSTATAAAASAARSGRRDTEVTSTAISSCKDIEV